MKTISGYILTKVLGWKIVGDFPTLNKYESIKIWGRNPD